MDALTLFTPSYPLARVGNQDGDGGYVICDLPESYDLLLSGGIESDVTFEKQFLATYPEIQGFGFDGTVSKLPTEVENLTFVNKNVASQNSDTETDMLEYFKGKSNVLLKLDIEGCEFQILPYLREKGVMNKIKQLVLEVHTPCDIKRFPEYYASFLQQYDNNHMFDMIRGINKTHTLVHFHGNNSWHGKYPDQIIEGAVLPFVYELTFVRNDFVNERIKNMASLPIVLDRQNSPLFPDWSLNSWPYCSADSNTP